MVIKPSKMKILAGMAGIEPANDGTKTRCLTTWRHPNLYPFYHIHRKTSTTAVLYLRRAHIAPAI